MISTIISVSFVVLAILFALPGIIKARKRHWFEALVRIVLTVVSAILAFTLTSTFTSMISDALLEPAKSIVGDNVAAEILEEVPSIKDVLLLVLNTVITPVLFILIFIIVKFLILVIFARLLTKLCLSIAGAIAKKDYVSQIYDKKRRKFSPTSAVLGVVCGLMAYLILLIPVVETATIASSIGKSITDEGKVYEVSDALSNNVATYIVHPVGAPIWNKLARATVNGEKIVVENEVHFIAAFVNGLTEVTSKDINRVRHSADIFRSMGPLCNEIKFIPRFTSELINAADSHWLNGDDFAGISMPSLSTTGKDNIIRTLLECLDHSTPETMKQDLVTILNVLAIIAENAELDEAGHIHMESILENKTVISKFSVELLQSPRLAPAMNIFVKNHMEESNSYIELPDKESEEYTNLVNNLLTNYKQNVGDTVNESSLDNLSVAIGEALTQNGVILEEHEHVAIASTFIAEFGDGADLTAEEVSNFIEQYRQQDQEAEQQQ